MKQQKMLNSNKGITLIALVITIIVMLILVAVTVSMAVNGGLFGEARRASKETKNAIDNEQLLASGGIKIDGKWYASIDEFLNGTGNKDIIVFYINGTAYTAKKGMTWEQWINSTEYDSGSAKIDEEEESIYLNENEEYGKYDYVLNAECEAMYTADTIVSGGKYFGDTTGCSDCFNLIEKCLCGTCEICKGISVNGICKNCNKATNQCLCGICEGCNGLSINGICELCGYSEDECYPCESCGACDCEGPCEICGECGCYGDCDYGDGEEDEEDYCEYCDNNIEDCLCGTCETCGRVSVDGYCYLCDELTEECICGTCSVCRTLTKNGICLQCNKASTQCGCATCAGCEGLSIDGVCTYCDLPEDECTPCEGCWDCTCDGSGYCEMCGECGCYGNCDYSGEEDEFCPDCDLPWDECECA